MKIRTLAVTFDADLKPWELEKFRAAVAQKVGFEHDWFHNHNAETGGFYHRYPLIQYKIESSREAMRPMLLCIEQGVEEAHHLFSQPDWTLRIGDRQMPLRIHRLDVQQYNLGIFDTQFTYRLHKWMALNPENFEEFRRLDRLADRYEMLEKLLRNQIVGLYKDLGFESENQIEVRLTDLINDEWISYKNVKKLCFSVEFRSNTVLPDFIGLGKGTSLGFGVLRRQREPRPRVGREHELAENLI
jgi:hypothetical protein